MWQISRSFLFILPYWQALSALFSHYQEAKSSDVFLVVFLYITNFGPSDFPHIKSPKPGRVKRFVNSSCVEYSTHVHYALKLAGRKMRRISLMLETHRPLSR